MSERNLNVAIICIAKEEERYIKEWVDYHLGIGIDHIYICDNNDSDYIPKLSNVLQWYEDKVTIIDYNDVQELQILAYTKTYEEVHKIYDWIAFIDIDEFITIQETDNDIKKFLNLPKFEDADEISLCWILYDDNDLVHYEDRPVLERFTRELDNDINVQQSKCILNCRIENPRISIHLAHNVRNRYLSDGTLYDNMNSNKIPYGNYCKSTAYIRHYMYKTVEEYVHKMIKGISNFSEGMLRRYDSFYNFFRINEKTEEKIQVIEMNKDRIKKIKNKSCIRLLEYFLHKTKNLIQNGNYSKDEIDILRIKTNNVYNALIENC